MADFFIQLHLKGELTPSFEKLHQKLEVTLTQSSFLSLRRTPIPSNQSPHLLYSTWKMCKISPLPCPNPSLPPLLTCIIAINITCVPTPSLALPPHPASSLPGLRLHLQSAQNELLGVRRKSQDFYLAHPLKWQIFHILYNMHNVT